jgi:hypothetical protein
MHLDTEGLRPFYKLAVGMFQAAPGIVYLNQLHDASEAGFTTTQIYIAVANSTAFQSQSFAFSNAASNDVFAAAFVENVVGDTVDATPKANAVSFLVGLLNGGMHRGEVMEIALNALDNVANDHPVWGEAASLFDNQIDASIFFTEDLNGDTTVISELQNAIVLVTSDPASVDAQNDANAGASGDNFVFTDGIDDLLGTSGADTFIATLTSSDNTTFNTGDAANGGLGDDLLRIIASDDSYEDNIVTLSNIERVIVQNSSNEGLDLDATSWTGVTEFGVSNSNDPVEISNISEPFTTASVTNFGFGGSAGDEFSLFVADDVFSDSSDSLTLVLDRAGSNSDDEYVDFYIQNDSFENVIENLIVDSKAARAGDDNYLFYNNADDTLETITIMGSAGVAFTFDSYNEVTLIDASGATGKVDFRSQDTVNVENDFTYMGSSGSDRIAFFDDSATGVSINVSTGDGNDTVEITAAPLTNTQYTIDLGAGDDKLLGAAGSAIPSSNQSVDGGDGSDTLAVTLVNVGNSTQFSNFDILDAAGIGTSVAFDASIMTGNTFTGIAVSGSLDANATINNTGFSSGLTVTRSPGYYDLTLGFSGTSGTSDVLDIFFNDSQADSDNTLAFGTLKVNGIETFNIDSSGSDSDDFNQILTLSSNTVTTINVTGDNDFELDRIVNVTSTGLNSFSKLDASAAGGDNFFIVSDLVAQQTAATKANLTYSVLLGEGDDFLDLNSAAGNTKITTANVDLTAGGDDVIDLEEFFSSTASVGGGTVGSIVQVTGADEGDQFEILGTTVVQGATLGAAQSVGAATNIAEAIDIAMAAVADNDVSWFTLGGNTFIVTDIDSSDAFTSADTVIRLTGIEDLTDATYAGGVITLA